MKASKKSGFLTFVLSLFPGTAHMYMGFMKMGISLMGLFVLSISIAGMLNIGVLSLVSVLIWFYSFFHAHNLANLNDEAFAEMEDKFLFGIDTFNRSKVSDEKYRKYLGIGLIVFGLILLWNVSVNMFLPRIMHYFPEFVRDIFWRVRYLVPQVVFAIAIIFFGFKMMRGRQNKFADGPSSGQSLPDKNGEDSEVKVERKALSTPERSSGFDFESADGGEGYKNGK